VLLKGHNTHVNDYMAHEELLPTGEIAYVSVAVEVRYVLPRLNGLRPLDGVRVDPV
jgi:hypothetical protein